MDNEKIFSIALLPEDQILKKLNSIKTYFYTNNFKFVKKLNASNSHITIAECKELDSWKEFEKNILCNFNSPIKANVIRITDEIKYTEKYPNGEGWVSLLFDDNRIKQLFIAVDGYLKSKNKSLNDEYINSIRKLSGKDLDTFDCIGNHLNLCNHCRPEKVGEAKEYIAKQIPTQIVFDKVVVREKDGAKELLRYFLG